MEFIKFELYGFQAHFRKFYSTTTSLTYIFPPRTTISGIIAAALGLERDSYYQDFSSNNASIIVEVLTPLRIIQQKVNYLLVKEKPEYDVRGIQLNRDGRVSIKNRTQVAIEYVVNRYGEKEALGYRIYFRHVNDSINNELHDRLTNGSIVYPISLGPAYTLTWIESVDIVKLEVRSSTNEELYFSTPVDSECIESILVSDSVASTVYHEERVPVEFGPNRNPRRTKNYIVPIGGAPIKLRIKQGAKYYFYYDDKRNMNLSLMEL